MEKLHNVSSWLKAILYLLKSGIFLAVVIFDVILFFAGMFFQDLQVSREFYLYILVVGLLFSAIKVIKDEIIIIPELQVVIFPDENGKLREVEFYKIRWEKLQTGQSILTRYKVFIKNVGSVAKLPYIILKNSKLKNNSITIEVAKGSSVTRQIDSTRVTYNHLDILMKDESTHVATLNFWVRSDDKIKPESFFELPIRFGAMGISEKESRWKFKYEQI